MEPMREAEVLRAGDLEVRPQDHLALVRGRTLPLSVRELDLLAALLRRQGRIVPREELAEPGARPLESETWAACVDAVGGPMLSRVTKQLKYRCAAAAVGNAGGVDVPLSIIPFLLRGVSLLGIDSVMCPRDERVAAWGRLARDLPLDRLDRMTETVPLADVGDLAPRILNGEVRGRIVVAVGDSGLD